MKKCIRKLAGFLAAALLVTSVPFAADAAAKPAYKTTKSSLYENASTKGVYTYTIKNVKKGYKVKWALSGAGKKFAKLKYSSTTAKGSTSSNKIYIDTKKDSAAKNAKMTLTSKVYNAKGTLVTTLKDSVKLKITAAGVVISTSKITDDLTALAIGSTYDFDAVVTPSNSTSTTYWTVTSITGEDYSKEITADGKWTPSKEGKYTIKAMERNSKTGKNLCFHTATVTVGKSMSSLKQVAANKFQAVFNSDVSKTVKASDFTVRATNGTTSVTPKEISFSENGKIATVTNYTNFMDNVSYTISYAGSSKAFIASVGEVASAEILLDSVEVNKETDIEYALLDANGIDVKSASNGNVTIDVIATNGYRTDENKLYMTTIGMTAEITLTYQGSDTSKSISVKKTVRCVDKKATQVTSTDITITNSSLEPDYNSSSYKPVTNASIGEKAYLHFRAVDSSKKAVKYDSIQYISSDDDTLIIDKDGKITPIKAGSVKITIIAAEGKATSSYTVNITVLPKRTPKTIALNKSSIIMSNVFEDGYREYIDVAVKDQYGKEISLDGASALIKETSNKQVIATYDESNHRIVIDARAMNANTYNYSITFTVDGVTLTSYFAVVVKDVPTSGNVSFTPSIEQSVYDMVVDTNTRADKTVDVQLKKYIGSIFVGYGDCISATIKKDNLYYTTDLTIPGTKTENVINMTNDKTISLVPVKINLSSGIGECKKAETGTYFVTIKYYDSANNVRTTSVSLTLKDTQAAPDIIVKSTISSKTVSNALALVNECIAFPDDTTVYNCTVTGSNLEGDSILVSAGQKINVNKISVKRVVEVSGNRKVYLYYTVNLGRTLTNKA